MRKKKLDKAISDDYLSVIVDVLVDNKAEDVVVLNVDKKSSVASYFVIASALIERHVKALAGAVERQLRAQCHEHVLRVDGVDEGRWAILDYGDVLIHIFLIEERQRYRLEELWTAKE
ncbi:MAG: ribosome silencing factor [bacterium]